jgi:phosphatidylinositol alpha-1,6-mannosyltransferase
MLPDQRPYRELYMLSLMPDTQVGAVGGRRPAEAVTWIERPWRRLTERFVEAGALAWLRDLGPVDGSWDWVASLELCSLVSGQAAGFARRRGIRQMVLTWANDPRNLLYRLPPYRFALDRVRDADLFLCLVQAARDHCIELGLPEERCRVAYPGIDVELFHPPEQHQREPVALFASPLAENKGIDTVLSAFDLVRRELPEARLMVAGRGPLRPMVEARARDDRSVRYLGGLAREDLARTLQASAVFVTAPRPARVWNEQFGLAYVEAMASGLPVVTTICGTNHEAVRPPNLRVPDDPEAVAHGLLTFLRDPPLRERVGKENREVATREFDARTQARKWREAIASVE